MVYERLHGPLGSVRDDYNAAMVASTIAAVNAEKGKTPKLSDFVIDWGEASSGDDS